MAKKVYIKTYGCQMNEHDSQRMLNHLAPEGYTPTDQAAGADLIIVNTCSVREGAYNKAMSEIGRHRGRDQKVQIGVTGCVASQEGDAIVRRFDFVDFVIGTDHIPQISEAIHFNRHVDGAYIASGFQDVSDYHFPDTEITPHDRMVKAYVTIMKGCDNTCAFCIVPTTRGPEVSRPAKAIIDEIRELERHGVREVTLLGQNVNSYGKKSSERTSFADLLRMIDNRTSLERLRFTSPHPKDLSDQLIEEYRHNKLLCRHIHLPAQSGSNRVLKSMRRAHTRETYLRRVEKLRDVAPDVAITTDLIVGFPGETEADFQDTLSLMRAVQYDASYSFIYSERPGTEAASFEDDVPRECKQRRLQELQELQKEISQSINQRFVGIREEVLVEGASKQGGEQFSGRTSSHRIVNFHGSAADIGAIVPIEITRASAYALFGEIRHES